MMDPEDFQQHIEDQIKPPTPEVVEEPRRFIGDLPSHKRLDPNSETYAHDKWQRGHEQRRLKAYLKGGSRFSHGRTPTPTGYRSITWPVIPEDDV